MKPGFLRSFGRGTFAIHNGVTVQIKNSYKVLACCLAAAVTAETALANSLERMLDEGQYQQAYQQGLAELAQREGDPAFDFVFGRAAFLAGQNLDAIFAMERVLIAQPENVDARILLARALLRMDDVHGAEAELRVALGRNPDAGQERQIQTLFSEVVRTEGPREESLNAWVSVSLGHDSNVNSGSMENSFTPFFAGVANPPITPLGSDLRPQSALFHREAVGGIYYKPISAERAIDVYALAARVQNLGEDDFDRGEYKLNAGYSIERPDGRYRLGVRYQQEDVDDDRFRYTWGITGDYFFDGRYDFDRGWKHRLTAALSKVEYPTGANGRFRDVNQALVALTSRKRIGDFQHRLNGALGVEAHNEQGGKHNARRFASLTWGVQYLDLVSMAPLLAEHLDMQGDVAGLLSRITPYGAISYFQTRHNDELISAAKVREDRAWEWQMGLRWKYLPAVTFHAEYKGYYTDSNISLYEFERDVFQIGMQYQFQ